MTVAQDLKGRKAVVTGGARGLGRAIADRLAAAGAALTIVDLNSAVAEVPADWRAVACDLGDRSAKAQMRELADALGAVDIVVANAGVVPPWRRMADLDPVEWQRVMAINVWGVAATLGGMAGALAASGRGSAVVMASINGFRAHPDQVLYSASKHAVVGVMRAAALDMGRAGTRVNALAPGPIATEALLGRMAIRHEQGNVAPAEALGALAADSPLGRIATAEDVANVAHFLASDASAGMTGGVFPVDTGATQRP